MVSNLNNLQIIFNKMKFDGFDVSKELTWSFYFIDENKSNLENLASHLSPIGYEFDGMDKFHDSEWMLKCKKRVVLTPKKLHLINKELNRLARAANVNLYDGWDVEK